MKPVILLSLIFLAGCGADDELRYPGAPVLDLVYEDEEFDHFITGILASKPVPDTLGILFRITFRGYLTTDDREPFERTVEYITEMAKGLRYQSIDFQKDIFSYWNSHYGLGLDTRGLRPGQTIAVVSSLTVAIYPFAFGDRSPIFNVGVGSLTMESTKTPLSLR